MSTIGRALEQMYAEKMRDRIAQARPSGFRPASPLQPESYHLAGKRSSRVQAWAESFAALPRPAIPPELESAINSQNWSLAFKLAHSTGRGIATVDIEMLVTLPNIANWPQLLGTLLSFGNHPGDDRTRLVCILELLRDLELRVFGFDSQRLRRGFEDMPARVTVFRGTSMNEVRSAGWGLSWTFNRVYALGLAGSRPGAGGRQSRTHRDATGVLLFATIRKESIVAMVRWSDDQEIGEDEALICPRDIDPVVQWITADEAHRVEEAALAQR
jgi:hypothetical protein